MSDFDLLTVKEVAAKLRVHEETVRRWIRAGHLATVQLGDSSNYRIRSSVVDEFVDRSAKEIAAES